MSPVPHHRARHKEAQAVRDLGAVEYMRRARQEALGWIGAHPVEFALSPTAPDTRRP